MFRDASREAALRSAFPLLLVSAFLLSTPAAAASRQQRAPAGATVVDDATGRPLASAFVAAGPATATTGTDGRFSLVVPAGVDHVRVERLGYATRQVSLSSWSDEIRLEPAPYLLERIAVEVRRGEALASGTALAVASADRWDLDRAAATSVADALDALEGVEESRVGSWGSRPVVRGLSGERLAILIDGNRVNRACTFGMDQGLSSVDPAQVERVEVVSGPGSALYGSGNVGGVVNVVTRAAPLAPGTSGEVRAGGSTAVPGGTLGGSLWTGTERVRLSLNADASSYGDYRMPDATVDGSSYRQITGDAKVDVRPSPAHRISAKGQLYEGRDIGWPMMKGAEIPSETRTSLSLDYGWQLARGALDGLSVRAFRQRLDHHMTVDAVMSGPMGVKTVKADAESWSTTTGARGQLRIVPAPGLATDVGAEVTRWFAEGTRWTESGTGGGPSNEYTSRTWPAVDLVDAGAFFQGEAALSGGLTLSLGGRLDRISRDAEDEPSSTETVATANAGLRVELGAGLGLRVSAGLGYRAPDPMELYGLALKPDGFVYRGSPDLETERSRSAELSLTWSGARGELGATAFRNRLEDMIAPVLVPGDTVAGRPVRAYTPVGSATVEGVSATAEAPLGAAFDVRLHASWTRGTDESDGTPLVAIPALGADVTLRRTFAVTPVRWIEVEARAADAQDRVSEAAGEPRTPGWAVFDARLGAELAGSRITAGVENLLDRHYRSHLDPARLFRPGRNFFVRVSRGF